MDARVIHAAQALERLKELVGLEHRGELLYLDGSDLKVDEDKTQEAEEASAEAMLALEVLFGDVEDIEGITSDAIAFVQELGLPYPWLALEIVKCFLYAAWGPPVG
jgi:hypothetical protein